MIEYSILITLVAAPLPLAAVETATDLAPAETATATMATAGAAQAGTTAMPAEAEAVVARERANERPAPAGSDDLAWRWHDNLIYGVRFDIGDPEKLEWRSDLVFDIDFVAEWLCEPSGECRFRVAPATLTFHDVGDLLISIDHGDSDGHTAMVELSIDHVSREPLVRPFELWRWTIDLNSPKGSKIGFCASGFTQTLRQEPRLVAEQRLPRGERL